MSLAETETDALAAEILRASAAGASLLPITDRHPGFGLDDAYRVAGNVTALRQARGEAIVGWKIGFTNRTIWPEYGVHAPIAGPMWDSTVALADPGTPIRCGLALLSEPRIEPEIVLRLSATPDPEMDEGALLDCVDAVGHGFEIVQSLYPGWRFQAADTVAAYALHGRYFHAPLVPVRSSERGEWLARLASFEIAVSRNGDPVDRGSAANLLGGPLFALRHFVQDLAARSAGASLLPGHLVTTGTVTRALPVAPGEVWSSAISGLPLDGLTIRFE